MRLSIPGCLKGYELERAIADMGYRTDINEENAGGAFVFNSPDTPEAPEGTVCMSAELEFSSDYYSTFEFDGESGTYLKYHSGSPHKDGVTGNQLEFTNVFALETDISVRSDGKAYGYRSRRRKRLLYFNGESSAGFMV